MPYSEFATLLCGLMSDTPLGQIVSIRSEKDAKVLKSFTPEQKKIHSEWRTRAAQEKIKDKETYEKEMNNLVKAFEFMFTGNGVKK